MNSQLYDQKYRIPSDVLMYINSKLMVSPNGDGIKRAKALLRGGLITYQQLKRLKNFFEYFNPATDSKEQYELAGGDLMKHWVEKTLKSERDKTEKSSDIKKEFLPNLKQDLKTQNINPSLHENAETKEFELIRNSNIVVFNEERRFLLLKRSSFPDQWEPNKWCLVGGMVDAGEDPIEGAKRELKEETGIVIENFIEKFVIQRDNNVEHVFVTIYKGDLFNIKLDKENQGYGWFSLNEIDYLDTVPNLKSYIELALTKYD